jgi:hypothetical protein
MICTQADVEAYFSLAGNDPLLPELMGLLNPAEARLRTYLKCSVEQAAFVDLLPPLTRQQDTDLDFVGYDRLGGYAVPLVGGEQVLQLREVPVRAVASVEVTWVSGGAVAPAAGSLLGPANYYLDCEEEGLSRTGFVVQPYAAWPRVARSVRVAYTAGYTQDEMDLDTGRWPELKLAVLMTLNKTLAVSQMSGAARAPRLSNATLIREAMDDVSFSYDPFSARLLTGQVAGLTPEVMDMVKGHVNWGRVMGFMG